MNSFIKIAVLSGFCAGGFFSSALAEEVSLKKGDSANILWIGNSYTFFNDLPVLVSEIATENGITLNNTLVLKGGEKWEGHLQNPVLTDELKKGIWDYIILQEFSSTPAYSTKYVAENIYPYAEKIDSTAHEYSPEARTVLYMTWGHRDGNIRQTDYPFDDDYQLMQERIKTTYMDLAYELDAWCAPVGIAWQYIRNNYPSIDLYNPDNFHPSLEGSWLAANTIFETLYQKPFQAKAPEGISEDVNEIFNKAAVKAVEENKKFLNIK